MTRRPDRLFHYTCSHAAEKIRQDDSIRPGDQLVEKLTYAMLPASVQHIARAVAGMCWFTDLAPPVDRDVLGLTMLSLTCDRIVHCFEVVPDWTVIRWWLNVRREHRDLWDLEKAPGALPAHWFVSEHPVKVLQEIL